MFKMMRQDSVMSEVSVHEKIGQGTFCTVFSIDAQHCDCNKTQAMTLEESETEDRDHFWSIRTEGSLCNPKDKVSVQILWRGLDSNLPLHKEESSVSEYFSTFVTHPRDGSPRYALKELRQDLEGDKLDQATADLALEANLLMSLQHPNICKLQGTIGTPGTKDFAILLDRLPTTLRDKMMDWKKHEIRRYRLLKKVLLLPQPSKEEQLDVQRHIYGEKLRAVYDLARTLQYLAEKRIIYRDLKSANVGFDSDENLQLFDFGLAKELKDQDMIAPDMYNLTGMCGSMRYMAPEVVQCEDYGLSADVYSFGILVWEIMSNCHAFLGLRREKLIEKVVQKKKRPNLKRLITNKKVLPQGSRIHDLVSQCWSHDPHDRPRIAKVCDMVHAEILLHNGGSSSRPAIDRTDHLDSNVPTLEQECCSHPAPGEAMYNTLFSEISKDCQDKKSSVEVEQPNNLPSDCLETSRLKNEFLIWC